MDKKLVGRVRKKHIAEYKRKSNEIIKQNTPLKIPTVCEAGLFNVDAHFINKEVVSIVKKYKNNISSSLLIQCSSTNEQLIGLLSCDKYETEKDKYLYLSSKQEDIIKLKSQSDELYNRISKNKIELLNEDNGILISLKKSFTYLLRSEKCFSNDLKIKDFVCKNDLPTELSLFKYKYSPIVLFLDDFYFCLFSNVILVFDKAGIFSTAIDTSAFKVMIKRETISVTISDDDVITNQYIAGDSKCISQGETRYTWLHTCRDGSPDLRYNYNPRRGYRTDTYEYVVVDIIIGDKKISFSASSSAVGDSFEKSIPKYSRKCNNRHNPIPEFLQLIKLINESDTDIERIVKKCNAITDTNNYFCKLIES